LAAGFAGFLVLHIILKFFPYSLKLEQKAAVSGQLLQFLRSQIVQKFKGIMIDLPEKLCINSIKQVYCIVIPDRPKIISEVEKML
jgi:hypothetical protein